MAYDSREILDGPINNSHDNISMEKECDYETVDFDRFLLIMALGTPFAVLGILLNCILCILYSQLHHLRTPDLYLGILALLDMLICVLYLLLMTLDAVSVHYKMIWIYSIYMKYSIALFAAGRAIQLFSIYMVVAASVERFFMVRNWSDASNRGALKPITRLITVLSIFLICLCLRGPVYWEYIIIENDLCDDPFGVYQFMPVLAADEEYGWFNFYIMNVVQVFLPFAVLTVLNVSIIHILKRRLSLAEKFLFPVRYVSETTFGRGISREKLKSATYTLVAIVTSYLISNLLGTVIAVLEYLLQALLVDETGRSARWYTLLTDISSILIMINSCLRFPLYCWCSRVFRIETAHFFRCGRKYNEPLVEK